MSAKPFLQNIAGTELPTDAGGSLFDFYQLYGNRHSNQLSNEQRLLLEILTDAIEVIQKGQPSGHGPKRREYNEAVRWVKRPHMPSDLRFSFDDACEHLKIDPAALRKELLRRVHQPDMANSEPRRRFLPRRSPIPTTSAVPT